METVARLRGPDLPVRTCARRLSSLGARSGEFGDNLRATDLLEHLTIECGKGGSSQAPSVECDISWHGPARLDQALVANEATVQARCGLMQVHGLDIGHPRRLGIEAASIAAGLLAAQGILAGLIGQARGLTVGPVRTSVLQAGLLLVSHYVAAATCPPLPPSPSGSEPGPPFASADGCRFEIETLDPDSWKGFWGGLGVEGPDLGRAWTAFRRRYFEGRCSLPPGLHEATARVSLSEIRQLAERWQISLMPLRHMSDVLARPGSDRSGNGLSARIIDLRPPAPQLAGSNLGAYLPLEGIKVVEATSRMQGPLAGLLLQMLGAQVLRVEPLGGDVGRMTPPLAGHTGSFFLTFNRHKKSLELDLASPSGRADLRGLVAGADVFLQNWRPGKASEWGLDPEDLTRHNQRLVHAHASGWGDQPENLTTLGTDFLVQAFAGIADSITPEGELATPSRVLLSDFMGALVTCEAVLAGLYCRERTGLGCQVESSLLAGALALQDDVIEGIVSGHEKGRREGRPLWSALDRPLATVDGYLTLGIDNAGAFRRICGVCDTDPRHATPGALALQISLASGDHWEKLMADAGVPCAVVCTDLAELPSDRRLADLFEVLADTCQAPRSPWAGP